MVGRGGLNNNNTEKEFKLINEPSIKVIKTVKPKPQKIRVLSSTDEL
jgi:hypothetical protein